MREQTTPDALKRLALRFVATLLMGSYWLWGPVLKGVFAAHSWVQEKRGVGE